MFSLLKKINVKKSNKLVIIYRVCDSVEIINGSKRCFDVPKTKLIKKCLLSLKKCLETTNVNFDFYCIADNCSEELLEFIKQNFSQIKIEINKKMGNAESFFRCVEIASSLEDSDQVFFLEDDYLFLNPDTLNLLFRNLNEISQECGRYIAIMPDDYPDRYENNRIKTECRVTQTGHFLRIDKTTCTFATFAVNIKKYKRNLATFRNYTKGSKKAIIQRNKMWKQIPLYQPLPAWTLHCQQKSIIPRYIDFEQLKNYFESPL